MFTIVKDIKSLIPAFNRYAMMIINIQYIDLSLRVNEIEIRRSTLNNYWIKYFIITTELL